MTLPKLSILLVDDHPLTLVGLRLTLENSQLPFDPLEILEAAGCDNALKLVQVSHPDMAIIDLNLRDGHGIELAQDLKSLIPALKIIFYTGAASTTSPYDMLRAGGRGFLTKDMDPHLISQAIISVYFGGFYFGSNLPQDFLSDTQEDALTTLSAREKQVLRMLAEDYSKDDIAFHLQISVRTVETYRSRLMKKLGIKSNVGMIRYALANGIIELSH